MRILERLLRFCGLLALGALLVVLQLLLLSWLSLPSEISNSTLVEVLLAVIVLSGALIWLVLWRVKPVHWRLAIAGVGLLSVGSALAYGMLPEHNATSAATGAVGVLAPWPAKEDRGFAVGLAAHPHGCAESVPIRLVVGGSGVYWSEHSARPDTWLPFVIVLPGHFTNVKVGLGRIDTVPVDDPAEANVVNGARGELRNSIVVLSGKRNLTLVTGKVKGWSRTRRPVIVTADARWITRRGVNDCNLQLPALAGAPSALAVVEALTCQALDQSYAPKTCTDPSPLAATGAAPGAVNISPSLEVSEAAAMVTGSDVSGSESVPQPVEIAESPGWRCRSPSPTASPRLTAGAEAGSGSATASIVDQGNCHAFATVLASNWRRDFLLVLIGALVAVGVHMMFQALVETPAWHGRHRRDPSTPPDPTSVS